MCAHAGAIVSTIVKIEFQYVCQLLLHNISQVFKSALIKNVKESLIYLSSVFKFIWIFIKMTLASLKPAIFWQMFFFCWQGTSRPTHYHVLHDEIGFTADDLQELVHSLSYV